MVIAALIALVSLTAVPMPVAGNVSREGDRVAIRQDGSLIATVRRDGCVELHDAELKPITRLSPPLDSFCQELAFSPDGRKLAVQTHDGRTLLWALDPADPERTAPARVLTQYSAEWLRPRSYGAGLTWSPDSTRFVTINLQGHRRLYDADGKLIRRLDAEHLEHGAYDALWHEATRSLLLRDRTGVGVYDMDTGEPRMEAGKHVTFDSVAPPTAFALSPDGGLLAIGSRKLLLHLYDFGSRERLRRLSYVPDDMFGASSDDHPLQLRFSPNGEWLAMSSNGGAFVGVLEARTLIIKYNSAFRGGHFYNIYALRWWPTSDRILFCFECGCVGTSELVLGDEFTWKSYERLYCPRFSKTMGVGILDGELTSWPLEGLPAEEDRDSR